MLLLAYAALVAWLTWPLAGRAGTHLPATNPIAPFETPYVAWVLAHQTHALATHPSQLAEANIYHPTRRALFYGPTCWGLLPYFAPTYLATGNPALALNLALLVCLALTAWTLHLVVRHWTGSDLAGLVAVWTLLTTRWVLWDFIVPEPNYAVLQYIPPIMFVASLPAPGLRAHLAMFVLVVLEGTASPIYVAPAILAPLGVLALWRLASRARRRDGLCLLGVLVAAALVLGALHAGHLSIRGDNPDLATQTFWQTAPEPFPMLLPWGPLMLGPTAIPPRAWYLIAAGALVFAASSWRRPDADLRRAWAHAALWTVVGFLISVTPSVSWYDRPIELPHAPFMRGLAVYRVIRQPARLLIASLFGLAALAGLAFAECVRLPAWVRQRPALRLPVEIAAAALVMAAIYGSYPGRTREFPLFAPPSPSSPLVETLRTATGPVLELPAPLTVPAGPRAHTEAMYRSIFHRRPLLNGYSGYWPADLPERMALADLLPDPHALERLRAETGLTTVVVHRAALTPAQRASWDSLAARGGDARLALVARPGDDLVFAVAPRP